MKRTKQVYMTNVNMKKELPAFLELVYTHMRNLESEYAEITSETYEEVETPLLDTYHEVVDLLQTCLLMETGKEKRFEHC